MSLPKDFTIRMQNMLKEEYPAFLESLHKEQYQALRVNTCKGTPKDFSQRAKAHFDPPIKKQVPWSENAFYYEGAIRPGKHPYHEAGVYYIQEPSAMAPAHYLDARPGEAILDCCAAPGGKSTQIACQLKGEGILVCNEIHPARARILSENIERMGISNAIVTNASPQTLAQHFPQCFDRIMVDAPCSGEGMFRKNEEAISQWSPENVTLCAERQDAILDEADKMLRPGGRLVYSTCTFAPQENEGSILRFLERHPDYRVVEIPLCEGMSRGNADYYKSDCAGKFKEQIKNTLRLWPHKLHGEGHFIAVLQKKAGLYAPKNGSANSAEKDYEGTDFFPSIHPVFQTPSSPFFLEKGALVTSPEKGNTKKDKKREGRDPKKEKRIEHRKEKTSSCLDQRDALSLLDLFLKDSVRADINGNLTFFGEQIYLLPTCAPSLFGLKVLRAGLHLGSYCKNRFEPSHALALHLKPDEVTKSISLEKISKDPALLASKYINGETFPYEGENGWYLICLDGYSLGWGRLAGNIMKNYYPKGLRKNLLS